MNLQCPKCSASISIDIARAEARVDAKNILCIGCGTYFDASEKISSAQMAAAITVATLEPAPESRRVSNDQPMDPRAPSLVELTPAAAIEEFKRLSERHADSTLPPAAAPAVSPAPTAKETVPAPTTLPAPPTTPKPAPAAAVNVSAAVAKKDDAIQKPAGAGNKKDTPLPFPEIKRGRNVPKRIGTYDIIDEINRGGMGIVYKATDPRLRRIVAIKVLLGGDGSKDEDIMRFQREAQATARLHHPNIVQIHSVGEHDGMPYFVMDFVNGKTAKELKDDGRMTPRLSLTIIEGAADGLHHAHEHGVVHRDVKPANIIVDEKEHAQLMDFGLARRVDEDLEITQSGTTMGTPSYMSPEQAEGKLDQVDAQSDVYSLGACLYELLTGQPPCEAHTVMATLRKVLDEPPVPPRKLNTRIHRDVETICLKCLEKEKKNRYASAKHLAEDIRRFNRGEAIQAKPLSRMARFGRAAWRHKEVTFALAAIILFGIAALGFTVNDARRLAEQNVRDERQRLEDALDKARRETGEAKSAIERLSAYSPAEFPVKMTEAREQLNEAVRSFQRVESLAADNAEARHGLDLLKKLDNAIEVQRFIQKARFFLRPPVARADEPAQLPNFAGAEFAAQEAVDRDPANKEARELLKAAVGIRRVRIDVNDGDAEVFAKRILDAQNRPLANDPADAGRALGAAPISDVELEPGLYVITLKHANGSQQQATMQVSREARDEDLQLTIRVNGSDNNMVIVYAGQVAIPQVGQKHVAVFAIDRFEYPNKAGAVPFTDVTQVEAQNHCKQAGKTLCSTEQWLRACMGDDERRYPYGKAYASRVCATGYDADAQKRPFVSGAFPKCKTADGIYDMSGNTAEWTDTEQEESVFGGDWTSSVKFAELSVSCWARTLPEQVNKGRLGFRCCKSKAPAEK